MDITVGSLFAGVGGFDLGMERAGMRPAWQVEIDPHARAVLARHWPDARQLEDVRQVGAHNLPRVDVIVGGFPCQDLSIAGNRAGLAGHRSGLFYEMLRVINELKPGLVIWENVPGLLSSDGGRDFARVLYALGGIGYHGAWRILNAQYFGVPQRRRRVFGVFTGSDTGAIAGSEILAIANGMPGDSAQSGQTRDGATGGAAPGAGAEGGDGSIVFKGHQDGIRIVDNGESTAPPLQTYQNATLKVFQSRYARNGRGAPSDVVPALAAQSGGTGKGDAAPLVFNTHQEGIRTIGACTDCAPALQHATNGGSAKVLAGTVSSKWAKGTGGPAGDEAYNLTLQAGVRRLTPTECERLQGFPDGWTAGQADAHRYRQMGNAVCVPVVEWIGRRAVAWLERQRLEALDG